LILSATFGTKFAMVVEVDIKALVDWEGKGE
jgi:hypothetical protein